MFHIFFLAKTFLVTLVVLIVLQIRIGNFTLEERAMFFVHDSPVVEPLREVAQGAARTVRNFTRRITDKIGRSGQEVFESNSKPGSRLQLELERSRTYLNERAREAQQVVEKYSEDTN